jgi:hypothetical protein
MVSLQRMRRVVATLACLAGAALFCPLSQAQVHNVAGSYECTQVRAQGKVTPCRSAPLVLKKDGSFELRGWEGNYLVNGDWVELSDSLLKSRAKLEPGHKIIFHYHRKDGVVEVIYERRLAVLGKTSLS